MRSANRKRLLGKISLTFCLVILMTLAGLGQGSAAHAALGWMPDFDGSPYAEINGNRPYFKESEFTTKPFESYSELDSLGRCGAAFANVCMETMPTGERGEIGMVKPSGWNQAKYDGLIDSNPPYLYNRAHLIGWQLSGENANERNLITGTRYLNADGMLPFETKVADYVKKSKGHALYRVTPVFEGNNLLASGVLLEASSVEDRGKGLSFCVYCFNVQPGVKINYADGSSKAAESYSVGTASVEQKAVKNKAPPQEQTQGDRLASDGGTKYIGNRNTKKFHYANCSSVGEMKEKNKVPIATRDEAISKGYVPCKRCNP